MEAVKTVAVEWLDWAAKYAAKDPQDFFPDVRFTSVIRFPSVTFGTATIVGLAVN